MFALSRSIATSKATRLQNPLRMLWANGIGGLCNNSNGISSAITKVTGHSRLSNATKSLIPASYWLAVRLAHFEFQLDSDYVANGRFCKKILRIGSCPAPALIKAKTPEARTVASIVSPVVVNLLYFSQDDRLLKQGSGTIIDPSGIILTCAHLLGSHNSAEALKEVMVDVILDPSQPDSARGCGGTVLYADFLLDIAIIKITPSAPLQAAKLGSARELGAHDVVLSAGRCRDSYIDVYPRFIAKEARYISGYEGLFGERLSVTCLSDAGIDGGPLFNCNGEVVGVMAASASFDGLAISSDVVSEVLEHFKKHGRVIQSYMGVTLGEIQERDKTHSDISKYVRVVKVTPESPADCGELLPGDVVTEFDGKPVGSFQEVMNVMWDNVGKPLKMFVKTKTNMSVTLTVFPEEACLDTHNCDGGGFLGQRSSQTRLAELIDVKWDQFGKPMKMVVDSETRMLCF